MGRKGEVWQVETACRLNTDVPTKIAVHKEHWYKGHEKLVCKCVKRAKVFFLLCTGLPCFDQNYVVIFQDSNWCMYMLRFQTKCHNICLAYFSRSVRENERLANVYICQHVIFIFRWMDRISRGIKVLWYIKPKISSEYQLFWWVSFHRKTGKRTKVLSSVLTVQMSAGRGWWRIFDLWNEFDRLGEGEWEGVKTNITTTKLYEYFKQYKYVL